MTIFATVLSFFVCISIYKIGETISDSFVSGLFCGIFGTYAVKLIFQSLVV